MPEDLTIRIPKKRTYIGVAILIVFLITWFIVRPKVQQYRTQKKIEQANTLDKIIQIKVQQYKDSIANTQVQDKANEATETRVQIQKKSEDDHKNNVIVKEQKYEQIDNTDNHDSLRKLWQEYISN